MIVPLTRFAFASYRQDRCTRYVSGIARILRGHRAKRVAPPTVSSNLYRVLYSIRTAPPRPAPPPLFFREPSPVGRLEPPGNLYLLSTFHNKTATKKTAHLSVSDERPHPQGQGDCQWEDPNKQWVSNLDDDDQKGNCHVCFGYYEGRRVVSTGTLQSPTLQTVKEAVTRDRGVSPSEN